MITIGWKMKMKTFKEMKTYKQIDDEYSHYSLNRTICKCGHSVLITSKDGKELCTHCNRYVFATPELEKKYRKEEFIKTLKRSL